MRPHRKDCNTSGSDAHHTEKPLLAAERYFPEQADTTSQPIQVVEPATQPIKTIAAERHLPEPTIRSTSHPCSTEKTRIQPVSTTM